MKSYLNFQLPLGSVLLPFGSNKKFDSPSGGAAAFDFLSNAIFTFADWARQSDEAYINRTHQDKWNQLGLEFQQQQAKQQQENFLKSREWALQDLADERKYNSPESVVARLRKAGLNPAIHYGNGGPMQNVSAMSTPSPVGSPSFGTSPSSIGSSSFHSNFASDLATESNARSQSQLANATSRRELATAANLEIKNKLDEESLQSDLISRANAARKGTVEYERAQEDLNYFRAVKGYREQLESGRLSLQSEELKQAVESTLQQKLQNKLMQIQVAYAPKLSEGQLAQYWSTVKSLSAQAAMFASQGKLNKQLIQTEIAKGANISADTAIKQLHIDTNKNPEVKKAIISTIINEAEELQKELDSWDATWWNKTISGYVPFASGVGSAAVPRTSRIIKP